MGIVEGGELSGAAIQVDETWAKSWQETKAVINCNDTKPHLDITRNPSVEKQTWRHDVRIIDIITFGTTQQIQRISLEYIVGLDSWKKRVTYKSGK